MFRFCFFYRSGKEIEKRLVESRKERGDDSLRGSESRRSDEKGLKVSAPR